MQILASAPPLSSNPMSNTAGISAGAQPRVPTVEQMLSNVRNNNASAPPYELPTYEEAMAGTHRIEAQSGVNDLPYYFKPWSGPLSGKGKVVGQWEAQKWLGLKDAITSFAKSPITMEAGMSEKVVEPAVRAIATLAEMSMTLPLAVNQGDPYWQVMDNASTAALRELDSLRQELLSRTEEMQQYNPSYPDHFEGMAKRIDAFVSDRMPVSDDQFQREQQQFSEMTRTG